MMFSHQSNSLASLPIQPYHNTRSREMTGKEGGVKKEKCSIVLWLQL
jgi:hypothetical protein